jgi:hypothetical protein
LAVIGETVVNLLGDEIASLPSVVEAECAEYARVRRKSCMTHWATLVVRIFLRVRTKCASAAVASTAIAANFKIARESVPGYCCDQWI